MSTKRQSVDAWLERFLRRDSTLANPESTMGGQLERLQRNSVDSKGQKFVKRKTRPHIEAVPCRACGGSGADGECRTCGGGGLVGEQIGLDMIEYLVCKDDSAAHNVAHRADTTFADHGVDLMVWASLDAVACTILCRQREPVHCPGSRTEKRLEIDRSTCEHEMVRPLRERTRVGMCETCAATFTLDDKGKVDRQLVCEACGLQQRTHEYVDERGKVHQLVDQHVRRARFKVQRRLADRREGDGSEVIRPLVLDEQGFAWMWHYELVRRDNAEIACELGITERQLRQHITEARAKIAAALADEEPVVDHDALRLRRIVGEARWHAHRLREATIDAAWTIERIALRWGLLERVDSEDGSYRLQRVAR